MLWGGGGGNPPAADSEAWKPVLGRTRLQPDTYPIFPIAHDVAVGSIRLDALPDGGISRVRVMGNLEPSARRHAGYRWFNSLPEGQALGSLVALRLPAEVASQLVGM